MILAVVLFVVSNNFAQRGVGIKTTNGKDAILYENSYALVIGNSAYKDGSWGNLPGAKSDVEAVSDVLCQHGFKVEIAENLTSKTFKMRIDKFINDYGKQPNNRILIYYAGHGYKQKSLGDNRDVGYVVPTDAPSPQKADFVKFAVTMDTIENYAKEIQSKHALFVFDNCFSGKLVSRSPILVPNQINEKVGGAVRQFLTSGTSEQEVPDQSGFRRAFIRGLKGEADENGDGYTTASELAVFVKGVLYEEKQSPQYGKINDVNLNIGDFTFAKPTSKSGCATKETIVVENIEQPKINTNNFNSVVKSNFFKFEMVKCKLSGTLVSCDLIITNQDSMDKKLGFEWNTNGQIFDEQGNKSTMSDWVIANKSSDNALLLSNVPVKANIRFSSVSSQARLLKRIDLAFTTYYSEGGYYKTRDFVVKFQDISLR